MTAIGGIRAPALLSRSLFLNNPNLQLSTSIHRGLKSSRTHSKSMHSTARASSTATPSTIPHISLHIAASSSGKKRKFNPELNTYDWAPSNTDALGLQKGSDIQEKRKGRPDSGQDAYFVARVGKDSNTTAFAIADGVGGWTDHGIDPADFSHGLCSHMAKVALSWSGGYLGPRQLLSLGYQDTIQDPEIRAGGTTACVAVAEQDGRMRIANLGDSGFLQLRLGTVHHYSNPQTHAFNTPYQMSLTPPDILAQARIFGGVPLNDQPDRADLADHMLRHGDVLVLATDGLWDNLDAQDVLKVVSKVMRDTGAWTSGGGQGHAVADEIGELIKRASKSSDKSPTSLPGVLAAAIVGEAKVASMDKKRDGPFAKAVQKEYPYDPYHGGKVDDIAALVVVPIDSSRLGQPTLKAKL